MTIRATSRATTSHASRATSAARTSKGTAASRATAAGKVNAVAKKPVDDVKTATTVREADYVAAQSTLKKYSATQPARSKSAGQKQSDGSWNRGVLQVKQEHLGQGSLFTVYSGHNSTSDKFNYLNLNIEVQAPGQSYPQQYTLVALGKSIATKQGKGAYKHESVLKFYVSDKELEAAIKKAIPNADVQKIIKSARFAVHGNWQSGHNWGNFDRDGVFPFKTGAGAVKQVEPKIVVGLPPSNNVELDVTVPISASRKKKFAALDTKDAVFISHLEAEGKARVPLTRFKEIYDKLMVIVSDNPKDKAQKDKAMRDIFGSEASSWVAHRVKKYDPKGVRMTADQHGLLPVNPFNDIYLDNQERDLAKNFVVLRSRSVAGEKNSFTQINYKPGPGIRDRKTNVAKRIESELICKKEVARNPRLLLPFLMDASEPLNPHNIGSSYIKEATGRGLPAGGKGKDSEITAYSGVGSNRRFKFEFENKKTLVAFEVSLDLCATLCVDAKGMPLRCDKNGKLDPKGKFYAVSVFGQLEPEANHMSGVVGGAAGGGASAAPAPAASSGAGAAQAGGTAPAGGGGVPNIHIHGLKDLKSNVFNTDPGYVEFDKVMAPFQQWLFSGNVGTKSGAHSTEQKNAMGQRFAGTLKMSADEKQLYAQELEATAQFREKTQKDLDKAVEKAEKAIAAAKANYGRLANAGPKIDEEIAKAREAVWAAFGKLNPLDFVDLTTLPKL